MLDKIRLAMDNIENQKFLGTLIEVDETYVGGKRKKGNKKDDNNNDNFPLINKRGRGAKRNVIVGCVDRINKSVFMRVTEIKCILSFVSLLIKYNKPLNLIPFSGAGTMKRHINYLKTWNYKIKILLDDDKNGRDAKQNYIMY